MPVLLTLALGVSVWAGEPLEQVKQTTDKILSILNNPSLRVAGKAGEQKGLIWKAVDERFDWEEYSKIRFEEKKTLVRMQSQVGAGEMVKGVYVIEMMEPTDGFEPPTR